MKTGQVDQSQSGAASLLVLALAFLLIGVSALVAIGIGELATRRAEVRKIEALVLTAMARAGGQGALACAILTVDLAITCEFGGGEIALRRLGLPAVRVGWRGQESEF